MKKIFLTLWLVLLMGCQLKDGPVKPSVSEPELKEYSEAFVEESAIEEVKSIDPLGVDSEIGLPVQPTLGSIRLIEYFDYACEHCQAIQESIQYLKSTFGDKIEIESKPFIVYEDSRAMSLAAECARDQGYFEEFHAAIFALKGNFSETTILGLVRELDLNTSEFAGCITSGEKKPVLEAYHQEAVSLGIVGTPSFVLNDETVISGAYPPQILEMMLKSMIGSER